MGRYLTDRTCLYEVVVVREDRNYGLRGHVIRATIVRECVTEELRTLTDVDVALCDPVFADEEMAA